MLIRCLPMLLALTACVDTPLTPDVDEQPVREADPSTDPDPKAPVADAGEDFIAEPLSRVDLDGTRSFDPNGLGLIPQWRIVKIPKGSQAYIERADDLEPTFFADLAGRYEIELQVQNEAGLVDETPDRVTVDVVPSDAMYVQLRWDSDVDLDLHLVPTGDPVWGPTDCTWCNPAPRWGVEDILVDDASLDWDAIDGFGPETITVTAPAAGEYRAFVDVYGQGGLTKCRADGCPPTTATLDVYIDGTLSFSSQAQLDTAGQLWEAVHIDWPSAVMVPIDQLDWTTIDDCQTD